MSNAVYVIAEIGSNHDGNLRRAQDLIRLAVDAGADCAKFQLFNGDTLYPGRWTPGAIEHAWLPELQRGCREHGVDFLCSVFDLPTLAAYLEIGPSAIKVASPEATNLALLEACARTGLPLFVSTGAMDWDMLDRTMDALSDADVTLLHCVSGYPAPEQQMNLYAMADIAVRYGVDCGLSDHTLGTLAPAVAVALGATIIEKHLTYDRRAQGADHGFALEPHEFRRMVDQIRDVEAMLGDGIKRVMACEDASDRR